MDLRIDPTMIPQQSTVISHRQIIAVRLLQMAGQELTMAIARESESNPAFEADERESCHYCGAGLPAHSTGGAARGGPRRSAGRAAGARVPAGAGLPPFP